ncbi:hypothetical protein H4Q32_029464 [Labeo rohita]|uniref:LINE-1 type transposase domain-containing 1 n=1 Tax=Labeo rohita TaxID=84645 RepID=A0ABQ8L613_LABRO|nr:hypothetical protein H4Q32_029464 [Labeo rohita]
MQQIVFKGQRINIFPDLPPAVVRRRTLFKRARELLKNKPGIKYGLQYPAKLRVSHNGKEFHFTDPDKALIREEWEREMGTGISEEIWQSGLEDIDKHRSTLDYVSFNLSANQRMPI